MAVHYTTESEKQTNKLIDQKQNLELMVFQANWHFTVSKERGCITNKAPNRLHYKWSEEEDDEI